MSRPQSLTDAQRRRLHRLGAARRELVRQLKALPTRAQLAAEMRVSERTVARALDKAMRTSGGAKNRLLSLRELWAS